MLVSPLLSFLSLCLQVKADVSIMRRGHRGMRNAYNERVSLVEKQSIARLRDRLGPARNENEMFSPSFMHSSLRRRSVHSLRLVIFLLNDTDVDSWCNTGVPDST